MGRRRPRAPIKQRVAERVRALREEQGLSQRELAARAGTSRSQLAALELGQKVPRIEGLEALARALGTSVSDLIDDGVEKRTTKVARLAAKLEDRPAEYVEILERVVVLLDRASRGRGSEL